MAAQQEYLEWQQRQLQAQLEESEEQNDYDQEDEEGSIVIEIDERTMRSIIRVQALVRGFLTRKLIYEHLQQMVQQNELNQQLYGDEVDGDEVEDESAAGDNQMEMYDENGNPIYADDENLEAEEQLQGHNSQAHLQQFYQEPVQEVSTNEEESQQEYNEEDDEEEYQQDDYD